MLTIKNDRYVSKPLLNWTINAMPGYAKELLHYDMLNYFPTDGLFYTFQNITTQENKSHVYHGWKLHLSIHRNDLERGFNCVAKILSTYSNYFKFINTNYLDDTLSENRLVIGAQFTIYLEMDRILQITPLLVNELIKNVEEALEANGIQPGVFPQSDARVLHSRFFSLRNDAFFYPPFFSHWSRKDSQYLSAKLVGKHYNPCCLHNPFSGLISNEAFKLKEHFLSLPIAQNNRMIGFYAKISIMAFLREHSPIDFLSKEQMKIFKQQCFARNNDLDTIFIKEQFLVQANIKKQIKTAMVIASWQERYCPNTYPTHFAKIYSDDDDFKAALLVIDETMLLIEYTDLYQETEVLLFTDYYKYTHTDMTEVILRASHEHPYLSTQGTSNNVEQEDSYFISKLFNCL